MDPSLTRKSAIGLPSWADAARNRIPRACAPATLRAVPLSSIERLPAVKPSLGVMSVRPETILMRSTSTSSSSATICVSAVRMPWPNSTLPVKIVTVPSALMRSQPSSIRLVLRLPGSTAGLDSCLASDASGDRLNAIVSDVVLRKARRVGSIMPIPSPHARSRAGCVCACHIGRGFGPALLRFRFHWDSGRGSEDCGPK